MLITNDPHKTSGQLNDFTVITPIFDRNARLIAFFGSTCHAIDIGGRGLGADARSLYEEGLFVPIMKWREAGKPNEILITILRANVREPEQVLGDIHAQEAGNEVGGARLLEFLAEFGLDDVEALSDEIISRSERAMRAAIADVPDGVYTNSAYCDGFDAPLRLVVTITKSGDSIHVDWTGTDLESPRGINVVLNYTHAYVTYALKCALCPEVPNNEGSFRPVTVSAPPGCLLNAQPPAPVAGRHVIGHFLPGIIFGALAQVLPERVLAEGAANIWSTQITGRRAEGGAPWTYVWFSCGGTGARPTQRRSAHHRFPVRRDGCPRRDDRGAGPGDRPPARDHARFRWGGAVPGWLRTGDGGLVADRSAVESRPGLRSDPDRGGRVFRRWCGRARRDPHLRRYWRVARSRR